MKRIWILFIIVFVGMNAAAQSSVVETSVNTAINIKGSRVFVQKQKLDKQSAADCFSSLNGVDRSRDYLKYRAGYKTGLGLTIGGLSLAAVGYLSTAVGLVVALPHAFAGEKSPGADFAIYAGVASMFAGGACFLAGIPTICVYKTRLNRLEKEYNTSLQIGTSGNGISMALCF